MADDPRYHHGSLRAALIDAGFELARAGGPDAVSLREASRRVRVSHNAAYRHFRDRKALVRAVGERCVAQLAQMMTDSIAEIGPDDDSATAWSRLRQTELAYVRVALAEPGLFRTGFTAAKGSISTASDRSAGGANASPLDILRAPLDALVDSGAMSPRQRVHAEFSAWSAVHGFSMLLLEGPLRELSASHRDSALDALLATVERGLRA